MHCDAGYVIKKNNQILSTIPGILEEFKDLKRNVDNIIDKNHNLHLTFDTNIRRVFLWLKHVFMSSKYHFFQAVFILFDYAILFEI